MPFQRSTKTRSQATSIEATNYTRIDINIDRGMVVLLAALTMYIGYGRGTQAQRDLASYLVTKLAACHPQKDIHLILS
jgi:hypothetical protein